MKSQNLSLKIILAYFELYKTGSFKCKKHKFLFYKSKSLFHNYMKKAKMKDF